MRTGGHRQTSSGYGHPWRHSPSAQSAQAVTQPSQRMLRSFPFTFRFAPSYARGVQELPGACSMCSAHAGMPKVRGARDEPTTSWEGKIRVQESGKKIVAVAPGAAPPGVKPGPRLVRHRIPVGPCRNIMRWIGVRKEWCSLGVLEMRDPTGKAPGGATRSLIVTSVLILA